ncbi:hypothetical protein M422DRAFT_42948 [Sphaerobolus stellatus SS14]|nr:hypothetical protein M422DRAFT_42948 [Sphaerobolus stellatus SS14]
MSGKQIYNDGEAVFVITRGQGKLHHFSYEPTRHEIHPHVGYLEITNEGTTRIVVGHSYLYHQFAFYWEGQQDASYCIGDTSEVHPVGNSWSDACGIALNDTAVSKIDVTSYTPEKSPGMQNHGVTCYILPQY